MLKRGSRRIALNLPVRLSGEDREKCSFTLGAKATNLNRHGAAILLNRELQVGSTVVVANNRGTRASARVVAQVSAANGIRGYGIEFIEADKVKNFWGITFPTTT
jgi:PilZ domain-containing protein